jgi:UDP-N-acetylmuramoyl-tripeptide--D-alanyl-D-alanine ligase
MGMRGRQHISYLCQIAHPRIAGVINVGSAHIELLGSREAIAEAKAEIIDDLPANGTAIMHADNPLVMGQAGRTSAPVMTFGEAAGADVRASDVSLDALARPRFTLHWQGREMPVQLTLSGEHQVANALAATAFALAAGIDLADIVAVLETYESPSKWRMEVTELPNGVTIINDAYNANPESMRAALKALVAMGNRERRTWAVVGEMRELGDISIEEHDAIGRLAVRLDVSKLVAVGEGARPVHLGAAHEGSWGEESTWVPDVDTAIALLREEVQPGDIVLVKASRSIGLEVVAAALIADGSTSDTGSAP